MIDFHSKVRRIRSISAVIALMMLVGGILLAFIIAGASYWMQRRNNIKDLQIRAQATSDQLNYIAEILLNKGDLNSVQRIVENIATDRTITFIAIVDANLKVLASTQHDLLGASISEYKENPKILAHFRRVIINGKTEFIHRPEQGHFDIIAPIILANPSRTIPLLSGAVTVVFRDDPLVWNPRESFWRYLQLALVLSAFAIAILYAVLRRWVAYPIERLTRASERLGSGELGIQIPVSSSDEVGRLAETFNQMSVSLATQRRALQATEERYLRVFHSSPVCLIVVDPAGTIIDVNATFLAEMDRRSDRQVWIGKPITEILFIKAGGLQPEIQNLLVNATPFRSWKVSIPLPDKEHRCLFNFSGIPLFDDKHVLTGAVIAVEDITAEQTLEAQLIQSQKMESLGVLAGGIAHDFNNILTGILGYASLLKKRLARDDPSLPAVEVIEKSGLRARALIQQLMGFARRTESIKLPVDVNSLVTEIVLLLQKGMVGQGVSIQVDLDPTSPKIIANSGQLHQALMNLCVNARDALPPEGGTIFFKTHARSMPSLSDSEHKEEWVEVSVRDTGAGIKPEVLSRIFEPFFTTKEFGKGTGLGLSVTYGIVKAHGGEISVQSEPDKGSIFMLRFPEVREASKRKEAKGQEVLLKGKKRPILLVDDEKTLLELEKKLLEERDFEVLTAETGEEAIEIYRKHGREIHLVVFDLLMPGIGGWNAYLQLREMDAEVKVLFTSGYGGVKEFEEQIKTLPFLWKPYRIEEFLAAVEKALT
jgi:signal transduction histidine kinase/CheY-like chemotaxis protein